MSGTMSIPDLVEDLKAILMDASNAFTKPTDFQRHLTVATFDLARVRPRTVLGTLTLVADQPNYAAPADLLKPKSSTWGTAQRRQFKPWEEGYPGRLPSISVVENAGALQLWLDPAPSLSQILTFGAAYPYFYLARHQLAEVENQTTIALADKPLLLVRATAQALQELAHNKYTKPVQLGGAGVPSMPKNGTAAALADQMMDLFERMAA